MHVENFLQFIRFEKRYSENTLAAYKKDLEQFQVFLHLQYTEVLIEDASFHQIRSWIVYLMQEGVNSRSINRKLSTLRSFYKYLLRSGIIQKNPMQGLQGPKTAKRNPVFVPQTSMEHLLDKFVFPDGFEGIRDRALLETFYFTGIRRAELMGIRLQDLDFSMHTLKVIGKRNKERIIPLSPVLEEILKSYIREKNIAGFTSEFLFVNNKGKPIQARFLYSTVNKYLSAVTTIDRKSPHVLRHTFATHMLNNGAELNAIKEIMGHASLAATQVYTHNSLEKLKLVHKKAHPRSK
ncbi:MAG: tyrosine-type recombinase/integrase [Flavobacteriales bacterium]|nr:tyrosine-type recombinase/integrase [Flavobacteriales bacterium]